MKQLLIFTFYTYNDGNLRVIKIGLFILFISLSFTFSSLFFNEEIIKNNYINKGNIKEGINLSNIILSSLCCLITNFILKFIFLSRNELFKIKKEKQLCIAIKNKIKTKNIILFAVSMILVVFSWYYVSAFCAVFKNFQGYYLINILLSFIICNIWTCFTSLIAPVLRKFSLSYNSPCVFKASKIIAYI